MEGLDQPNQPYDIAEARNTAEELLRRAPRGGGDGQLAPPPGNRSCGARRSGVQLGGQALLGQAETILGTDGDIIALCSPENADDWTGFGTWSGEAQGQPEEAGPSQPQGHPEQLGPAQPQGQPEEPAPQQGQPQEEWPAQPQEEAQQPWTAQPEEQAAEPQGPSQEQPGQDPDEAMPAFSRWLPTPQGQQDEAPAEAGQPSGQMGPSSSAEYWSTGGRPSSEVPSGSASAAPEPYWRARSKSSLRPDKDTPTWIGDSTPPRI